MRLPKILTDKINLEKATTPTMGFSDATVLLIKEGYQQKDVVIKYGKSKDIEKEANILKWLKDRIEVPEVYEFIKIEETYYLIMEMLPGVMGQYGFHELSLEEMVILYANEIKKWHQIDYSTFPTYNTLEDKIKHAKGNVEKGLVKTQYFERELQGKSGQEVYDEMLKYYPKSFDLVLCHGDVCMPNFMYLKGKVTGWIDVVGCGVNDRYLDIAIALRTLRFNFEWVNQEFSKAYMDLFLNSYGIKQLDMDKVKFYILLDELTNG